MKKLSHADEARLADIIARLEGGKQALADGHQDLLLAVGEYNQKINAYNEVLEEARGFTEDLVNEMDEFIGGRSDKWQEGDAGQAYSEWKQRWEELDLSDIDALEEPPEPEAEHYQELTDMPSEPDQQ